MGTEPVRGKPTEARPTRTGLPDYIPFRPRVLFVGYNPGRKSAAAGHHFAGPNNHFWRLLHESGFTERLFPPEEDALLPAYGLGLTNIVARMTPSSSDLSWAEMLAGGGALRDKVDRCRPQVVCLLGKDVYRAYAGLSRTRPVAWGFQAKPQVPGTRDFVMPNPSSRSTVPYQQRLALFRELQSAVAGGGFSRRRPSRA